MGFAISQLNQSSGPLNALVVQTDQLEAGLATLQSLTSAEAADVALIRLATANLLAVLTVFEAGTLTDLNVIQISLANQLTVLTQIYGTATNSESALNTLVDLNQQIYDQIKPLEFKTSNLYDANSHQIGSPLFIPADPLCRKKSILNDTGESGGSGNTPLAGQAWIFGSYRNGNVNQDDFDFVIDPGDTHVCDLSASDVWLVCINQSSPSGRFLVMEYQ
jgi:hypothetical protein